MAICKCKMCGGDLTITELDKIVVCEYCGTTQTVPSADNEKKMTLFNRANRLRMNSEFDKAAGIYENIIAEFPEEAEAYWGALLCKYGIEYVDDPATGEKKPTCHRASFEKAARDEYFELAMEYADVTAQKVYRDEAREIDRINEEILSISRNEQPYDIFICYKETDESGNRTPDSVMAQDIYDALVNKGYKVFFSRITLEDKLGLQYEPYIFAALNSAKIMLCVGTKYEYFHAVWVKNEWSRFLRLAAKDKSKVLIPCYRDMDPYDMPDEFRMLQAQDLGKLGAMQDLTRGVAKILGDTPAPVAGAPVAAPAAAPVVAPTENLLNRAYLFLEDGDWTNADAYAEKVLDLDFENAEAYLVKALSSMRLRTREALADREGFDSDPNIAKAQRFGSAALQEELAGYLQIIQSRMDEKERAAEEVYRIQEQQKMEARQRFDQMIASLSARISETNLLKNCISCGAEHLVCMKADGSAIAFGVSYSDLTRIEKWKGLIAVAAGGYHTIGLKSNGTLVAEGDNSYSQCEVSGWQNIVAVAAGAYHTLGLKADGTVVAMGCHAYDDRCNVVHWRDILAISAGDYHSVGICSDGTVVAVGKRVDGQCEVNAWESIIAVSAGGKHTLGLRADGTVVATGRNNEGQCDVFGWQNMKCIAAGERFSVGLRTDGTVVACGDNRMGQCDVAGWKNIVAIAAGDQVTIGLQGDGVIRVTGGKMKLRNSAGQRLFENYRTINTERIRALQTEQRTLFAELPGLNGFLNASKRNQVRHRLSEIDEELRMFTQGVSQ